MFIAILRKCVDVPKEVCVLVRTNPRTVKRPLVKKWCGPDPNVSDNPMTHPVWFLWGAVNNHYVLPMYIIILLEHLLCFWPKKCQKVTSPY